MNCTRIVLATLLILVGLYNVALPQELTVRFRNAMQTTADVRIVEVGTTDTQTFELGTANTVAFNFTGARFDIQVIPRDEPNTGFRYLNVDLRELAAQSQGGIVQLEGIFKSGRAIAKRYWCRRCCRYHCYWQPAARERVAVLLTACINGKRWSLQSPKFTYSDLGLAGEGA